MPNLKDRQEREPKLVAVYLGALKIVGYIHQHPDVRLSDDWNRDHRNHIPLTECTVFDRSAGEVVGEVEFVMVNKTRVDVIYPEPDGRGQEEESPGAQGEREEEAPEDAGDLTQRLRRIRK